MDLLKLRIATVKDLPLLNHLDANMDEKPLISDERITAIWDRIQQVPDYNIYC